MGWRDYWSCWYSSGIGTEPQCSTECTNEEDTFWSVQDVMLIYSSYRCRDLRPACQSGTCTVLKLVFVDFLVRCHHIKSNKHRKKKRKKITKVEAHDLVSMGMRLDGVLLLWDISTNKLCLNCCYSSVNWNCTSLPLFLLFPLFDELGFFYQKL